MWWIIAKVENEAQVLFSDVESRFIEHIFREHRDPEKHVSPKLIEAKGEPEALKAYKAGKGEEPSHSEHDADVRDAAKREAIATDTAEEPVPPSPIVTDNG